MIYFRSFLFSNVYILFYSIFLKPLFSLYRTNFYELCFHFHLVENIFKFLLRFFPLTHVLFRCVLFFGFLGFFNFWILFNVFFIQQVLISHQFYAHQCIHVNPNLPIHHTTTPPPAAFPPWYPYVSSLHLCLNFCPANQLICTIFPDSKYMH